jgi:AcrR family transcriptional regulator
MPVKQRAMGAEDKQERRSAILDAAERLFLARPDRDASVAEVAHAAGVAKGTVYLYFPSKEEMLLALHERHGEHFFEALSQRLAKPASVDFDVVFRITRKHLFQVPAYLPLTSRCFAMLDREIPLEAALAFKARIGLRVARAGGQLEQHFQLPAGAGISLLLRSYALIVGLWQLLHPNERFGKAMERPELRMLKRDYERDIEEALRELWTGLLARANAPTRKRKKP